MLLTAWSGSCAGCDCSPTSLASSPAACRRHPHGAALGGCEACLGCGLVRQLTPLYVVYFLALYAACVPAFCLPALCISNCFEGLGHRWFAHTSACTLFQVRCVRPCPGAAKLLHAPAECVCVCVPTELTARREGPLCAACAATNHDLCLQSVCAMSEQFTGWWGVARVCPVPMCNLPRRPRLQEETWLERASLVRDNEGQLVGQR